jgi:hypothetical protein
VLTHESDAMRQKDGSAAIGQQLTQVRHVFANQQQSDWRRASLLFSLTATGSRVPGVQLLDFL